MRILSERRAMMAARIGRAAGAVAVLAGAALIALPAAAEGVALSSTVRADLSDRVDVKIVGRIEAECLMGGGGDIAFGELRGGEGATARFGFDCNVPFDIDIKSARGGLAHTTQPRGEGPFAGTLEYDLSLTVPTLRPTPAVAQVNYSSRQLLAARTLSSGQGIAAGGGTMEVRLHRPEGAGLLAGDYSETITLTVAPRM